MAYIISYGNRHSLNFEEKVSWKYQIQVVQVGGDLTVRLDLGSYSLTVRLDTGSYSLTVATILRGLIIST
jgi:hypothetical protein